MEGWLGGRDCAETSLLFLGLQIWQRELMLNKNFQTSWAFFLLYSHIGKQRQPGSLTLSGNNEETIAESVSLSLHCQDHNGKPKIEREKQWPSHQLHILHCKLGPIVHHSRVFLLSPPLFCQWLTAYIPLTATTWLCTIFKNAWSLETDFLVSIACPIKTIATWIWQHGFRNGNICLSTTLVYGDIIQNLLDGLLLHFYADIRSILSVDYCDSLTDLAPPAYQSFNQTM